MNILRTIYIWLGAGVHFLHFENTNLFMNPKIDVKTNDSHKKFFCPCFLNEAINCVCLCSDEDTDVGALVKSWLKRENEENRMNLENWLNDYFHRALDWVLKQVPLPDKHLRNIVKV